MALDPKLLKTRDLRSPQSPSFSEFTPLVPSSRQSFGRRDGQPSTPTGEAQEGFEDLILGVDSVYEWRDARGRWWPITLITPEGANLSASVHDGRGSRWQTVSPADIRLVHDNAGFRGVDDSRQIASAAAFPRHALRTVAVCRVLDALADTIFAPALPILAFDLGATVPTVVLMYAVWSVAQLVASPVLTTLAEQCGPRNFLLLSILCQLGGMIIQCTAPDLSMLVCGRAFSGAFAMTGQLSSTYLSEGGDPAFLSQWRTIQKPALGAVQVLGPPLGGCLAMVHCRMPAVVAALIGALNFVSVAINTRTRSRSTVDRTEEDVEDPEITHRPPSGLDLSATCLYGGGINYCCRVLGATLAEEHLRVTFYASGDGAFGPLQKKEWAKSELWAVLTSRTGTTGSGAPHAQMPLRIQLEECEVSETDNVIHGVLCFAATDLPRVAEYQFRFGSSTAGYNRCVLPYPQSARRDCMDGWSTCCSTPKEGLPVSASDFLCGYVARDVRFLFLAAIFTGICHSLPLAVLPAFAVQQYQYGATDVGLLLSVSAAATVVPSLYSVAITTDGGSPAITISESLVRSGGPRWTAAVCLIVSGTSLLLIPVFPFPWMMTAMLSASRAARAVGDKATRAVLKETFGSRLRSPLLVRCRQTCLQLGFTIGPVLACALLDIFPTLPFLLAALAGLLAAYFVGAQEESASSDKHLTHELSMIRPVNPQVEAQWAELGVKIAMLLRRKRYPIAVSQPHILQTIDAHFPSLSASSRRDYVDSLRSEGILGRLTEQSYEEAYARYGALERQHL